MIGFLCFAFPGCAHHRAPPPASATPPPESPVDPVLALRVAAAESVTAFRIGSRVIDECDPVPGDRQDAILCHPVLRVGTVPSEEWSGEMVSLVLWGTVYREASIEPDLRPAAAVRFEADDLTTDVLISLYHRRLRVESTGLATYFGSFGDRIRDFLSVIAKALPHDLEIQELVDLEERTQREDAAAVRAANPPIDPDADCYLREPPALAEYDVEAVPTIQAAPIYPEFAKDAQIQGTVILSVYIDALGRVCSIKVAKSVKGLDQSAISAMKKWKFKPASLRGVPVGGWLDVSLKFHL